MTPLHASLRPTICRIQSQTTSSSSLSAGLDCQESPRTPSPVLRKSPSTELNAPLDGKYPKKLGCCQCESPGTIKRSTSPRMPSSDSPVAGGAEGSAAFNAPGSTCDITGRSLTDAR